jgi:hypothetical protein
LSLSALQLIQLCSLESILKGNSGEETLQTLICKFNTQNHPPMLNQVHICFLRCQFIWIFHFLFPLRYALTFILTVNVPSGVVPGEHCSLLPKSQS